MSFICRSRSVLSWERAQEVRAAFKRFAASGFLNRPGNSTEYRVVSSATQEPSE
jgi:hypothetical protein